MRVNKPKDFGVPTRASALPYFYILNLGHKDYRDECMLFADSDFPALRTRHLSLRASAMASVGVAQAFDIDDLATLRHAVAASLCLDHFGHAMDDAADLGHAVAGIEQLHAGSLLLARGIRRYSALNVSGRFWEAWQRYMDEASGAERALLSRRGRIERYTDDDLRLLGKKSALVKTNAALFADISGRWERLEAVESALEWAAVGVQLVDDIFDWKEDFFAQDYTYPLTLLFEDCDYRQLDEISEAFDEGDVLDRVARLSIQYMRGAESRFAALDASWLSSLSASVSDGLERYLAEVAASSGQVKLGRQMMLGKCIRPQVTH